MNNRISGKVLWFDNGDGKGVIQGSDGRKYFTGASVFREPNLSLIDGLAVSFIGNSSMSGAPCAMDVIIEKRKLGALFARRKNKPMPGGSHMKTQSYHPIWTVVILFQIMLLGASLHGCGMLEARGGDAQAISFPGPDGVSTCYVVYDSGKAVGGNCSK